VAASQSERRAAVQVGIVLLAGAIWTVDEIGLDGRALE
jgi:hypothetical protein